VQGITSRSSGAADAARLTPALAIQSMKKKKPSRPDNDFRITCFEWLLLTEKKHRDAGFEKIDIDILRRRYFQFIDFMQRNDMTNRIIHSACEDVGLDSSLWNSDVNDVGYLFVQDYLGKWQDRLYKDKGREKEEKMLDKWLVKFHSHGS